MPSARDLPGVVFAPRGTARHGSADVGFAWRGNLHDGGATAPYGGTMALEFTDNMVQRSGPTYRFETLYIATQTACLILKRASWSRLLWR